MSSEYHLAPLFLVLYLIHKRFQSLLSEDATMKYIIPFIVRRETEQLLSNLRDASEPNHS